MVLVYTTTDREIKKIGGYLMARVSNQKMKTMYLLQLFFNKTDEAHYVTMVDILNYLKGNGITAERKSIYADIEALKQFGFDIKGFQEKGTYFYHLVNRKFELAELKLLVDIVQSSKFVTAKKSNELIKKIESLSSKYESKELQRQVYVDGRIKNMNESIYYNVDNLHTAITANSQITFQYFQWTVDKKIKLKKEGALYKVSPWALMWNNENYYMVAYDSAEEKIKHFRVDKMLYVTLTEEERDGKEYFKKFDIAVYAKKMFGMFGGTEETVRMECNNDLVGVIFDHFGKDVSIIPIGREYFAIIVDVQVSRKFIAWVIGLGAGAKIVAPKNVVDMMREESRILMEQYR